MKAAIPCLLSALLLAGATEAPAEFLFTPGSNATPNGFYTPTLNYSGLLYEYSAWDIFYSPHTYGNYPDIFAPYGGVEAPPGSGIWEPTPRPTGNPAFPARPGVYDPDPPFAFWDVRNPTITQVKTNTTFIIGADISGNIYTYQTKTGYVLENDPDYNQLGTVIFQFQTAGTAVDFSTLRLVWTDGFNDHVIYATEAEYLREYRASSGGGHWSASAGYDNRVAVQWDLSGLTDPVGNPITAYKIYWESEGPHMSFQKADLVTADEYEAGIPISAAWIGAEGNWSDASKWLLKENSGLTLPQTNGNIRFQNPATAVLTVNDGNHTVGEVVFESASNVTINALSGHKLTANTGVATREGATGTYTINAAFELGSLNFFEVEDGTVVMGGVVSGNYGLVKSGQGTLILKGSNTFGGFLAIQDGTVRIEGTNAYSGATTMINGTLIVAADAGATGALGSNSGAIAVGADAGLYAYVGVGTTLEATLLIAGDHTISRNISLAAGDFGKRLGSQDTVATGAFFSGTVNLTTPSADPDALESSAGNVSFTAVGATDVVTFSGQVSGGHTSKTITVDGGGTVVYSGADKTYQNATLVRNGRLRIANDTSSLGNGAWTVKSGATLEVDGTLGGTGTLVLDGGTLSGRGTVERAATIAGGSVLSPADTGVGSLAFTKAVTLGPDGVLQFGMHDVGAGQGTGWDFITIEGSLEISATSADPFVIQVQSFTEAGSSGLVHDFDGFGGLYDWTLLTASQGINGWSADKFSLNFEGFVNSHSGSFSLDRVNHGDGSASLVLHFDAVPEPGRVLLIWGSLTALAFHRRRRAAPLHHAPQY